jgi:catechol 2,3-dioxygenase-like lactoylglutathione lyase family enzyme
MKFNHLDLQVSDVQRTVLFFERHFGLELQSSRTSPALAILGDGHGFVLVLQRKKNDADAYPEGFHVGFLVDDPDTVRRKQADLRDAGADVSDVIENGRGVLAYCRVTDGIMVEIAWHRTRDPVARTQAYEDRR